MMQTYYNLTPLCSDTHSQLQHYRCLPRPADFKGANTGTIVDQMYPEAMLAFYESIHDIYSDFTLSVYHNHWIEPLAELVNFAVESTTIPPPVTVPKMADLRKIERWRMNMVSGATVIEYLHHRRGSNGHVWARMFEYSDVKKDVDMLLMDINIAAAGVSKDCDSPFDPTAPIRPAKKLVAARDFKQNVAIGVLVGTRVSAAKAKDIRGNRVMAPLSFTAANYMK